MLAHTRCALSFRAPLFARLHRAMSTTARHDPSKTRNMALVAHIDSGKTTLTESILLKSSYISTSGTVDTGSTTTDFLPAERERGITIQSASIPVNWKNWTFNLVDTPGHADFGMEVESASRVVDGAVVLIDSVEGVEAQTSGVWRQLDRYGVPTRMIFLNKLDRPGASFRSSLLSILSHRLHPRPTVVTLPIASFSPEDYARAEPGVSGLVDLVKWEVWKWKDDGSFAVHPLPTRFTDLQTTDILPKSHPVIDHLLPARVALLENLSMFSEDLMESLLSLPDESHYLTIPPAQILPHLRSATLRGDVLPVLCGSAMRHVGTELVMDYVGELFASPLDVRQDKESANAPLRALAWKVSWDKRRGWMTFVRVYSGSLKRHSTILNKSKNQREKVSKVLLLYASEAEEVESIPYGSIGVILGLKFTRTGDTLESLHTSSSSKQDSRHSREIIPPTAVMSASVVPNSHSDAQNVHDALLALVRTDPSVRVETQESQILVHGLGALHLEIVEGRLRDEWEVNFEFGKRTVSYREGPADSWSAEWTDSWSTEVSGRLFEVAMSLLMRPLAEGEPGDASWDGNVVVDRKNKPIPSPETLGNTNDPLSHTARGLLSTLSNSPNSSLPISHVFLQVQEIRYSHDTPLAVLSGAATTILRRQLQALGLGHLMEPSMRLKVTVGEDSLGPVVKDITEHDGEVLDLSSDSATAVQSDQLEAYQAEGLYVPPDWLSPSASPAVGSARSSMRIKASIHAIAPLSQLLDYSNRLRAMTGGHGVFEMSSAGFKVVSESRKEEILKEIGRA